MIPYWWSDLTIIINILVLSHVWLQWKTLTLQSIRVPPLFLFSNDVFTRRRCCSSWTLIRLLSGVGKCSSVVASMSIRQYKSHQVNCCFHSSSSEFCHFTKNPTKLNCGRLLYTFLSYLFNLTQTEHIIQFVLFVKHVMRLSSLCVQFSTASSNQTTHLSNKMKIENTKNIVVKKCFYDPRWCQCSNDDWNLGNIHFLLLWRKCLMSTYHEKFSLNYIQRVHFFACYI